MRKANKAEPSWNMSMTVHLLAKLHVTLLPLGELATHCTYGIAIDLYVFLAPARYYDAT